MTQFVVGEQRHINTNLARLRCDNERADGERLTGYEMKNVPKFDSRRRKERGSFEDAPAQYKQFVGQRLAQGRWHSFIFRKPNSVTLTCPLASKPSALSK